MARLLAILLIGLAVVAAAKVDPQDLLKAGLGARAAGDNDTAIRLLSEAIATRRLNNDDLATAHNNRGIARYHKHEFDKALADYDTAIRLAPVYGPAYLNRGNLYSDKGELDRALADFNTALKISPAYDLAYNSRGAAFYRKGAFDAAIADYDKAISLKPDYGNAYWNRARVYYAKQQYDRALSDFDSAIRYKPSTADIYGDRGDLYFDKGEIDKALADYDAAIRLAPNLASAHASRGRIALFHTNGVAAAADDLAAAVRLEPDNAYWVLWLHIARLRMGTDDRAELAANAGRLTDASWPKPVVGYYRGSIGIAALRAAVASSAEDSARRERTCEADFYIGVVELKSGNHAEARRLLQSAADGCQPTLYETAAARAELRRLAR